MKDPGLTGLFGVIRNQAASCCSIFYRLRSARRQRQGAWPGDLEASRNAHYTKGNDLQDRDRGGGRQYCDRPEFSSVQSKFSAKCSDIHGEKENVRRVGARISLSLHASLAQSKELEFEHPYSNTGTKQRTAHQSTQKYSNVFCVVAENWQD